jgi:hypothetical protein
MNWKDRAYVATKWLSLVLSILLLLYSHVILYQTKTGLDYDKDADLPPEMENGKCEEILQKGSITKYDCYPVWNFSGTSFRPPLSGSIVTYKYPDRGVFDSLDSGNLS